MLKSILRRTITCSIKPLAYHIIYPLTEKNAVRGLYNALYKRFVQIELNLLDQYPHHLELEE